MKGEAIKLKSVAKTTEKAIYKWRPARLLRFAELRVGAAQWTRGSLLLRVRSQRSPRRLGMGSIGLLFSCPILFLWL